MSGRRITFKLALAAALVALALGLATSLIQTGLDFSREQRAQDALISRILEVAKPTAARAVVVIDANLAREVASGLLAYDFIRSAKITDDLGKVLASRSNGVPGKDDGWLVPLIPLLVPAAQEYAIPLLDDARTTGNEYAQPGSLKITVDTARLYAPFAHRVLSEIGLTVFQALIFAFVLMGLFHVLVTRPLISLAGSFDRIAPNEPGAFPLPISRSHRHDELGMAARAGNRLLSSIQQLLHERKRATQDLRAVTEAVSSVSGENILDDLAERMAKILKVDCVLIAKFADAGRSRMRTVTFFDNGRKAANFEYELAGSPCEHVVATEICLYNGNVPTEFPEDEGLKRLGITTYVGAPLFDSEENPIGLIVALNREPLKDAEPVIDFLHIFGVRAAAELERSSAEAKLRESEERLRAILDNATAVIYVKDMAGRFLLVNRQFEKLFNVTNEALSGKTDHDILPKDAADMVRKNDRKVLDRDVSIEFEEAIPQADGEHAYISIKFPLRGASGKPYAVCGISTDITARKRAERELTTQTRNLALAEQIANLGHWRLDLATRKIHFSDQMYRIRGMEVGTPITWETLRAGTHPDDWERIEEAHRKVIETKQGTELDRRIIRPDGNQRVLRTTTRVELGEDGEVVSIVGVSQDITQRKQADEALERAERRYRGIVENATDGIFQSNEEGRLIWANPALARMGGFETANELLAAVGDIGTDIFVDPNDRTKLHALLKESGSVNGFVAMGKRPATGETFWFDASVRAEHDANDRLILDGVIRDITEARRRDERARRVEKMQAIGQLTGGIAHDFNNLLGIMVGNLDMLQDEIGDDPKLGRPLATALRASLRGADLTKQLMRFARQSEEAAKPFNLNDVIREMDELLAKSVTNEVEIRTHLQEDLWHTEISRGDFEDSLINLAMNARDAMAQGGTLTIETENSIAAEGADLDLPPGEYVGISVSDNGTGMPADIVERAFEPFFTTKEAGKGTGLGLSMVYGFVRRSGGQIRITSEPGLGTTIRICLPRARCDLQRSLPTNTLKNELPRGDEVVLVVDDEPDLVQLARTMLEALGYTVITACGAQGALEELSNNPQIDVLFTDVVMPGGMGGLELAEAAQELRPDIKILLTTGFSDKINVRGPHADLMKSRVAKPYRAPDLAWRLRAVLDSPV